MRVDIYRSILSQSSVINNILLKSEKYTFGIFSWIPWQNQYKQKN